MSPLLLLLLSPALAALEAHARVETVFRTLHSLVPGHGEWSEVVEARAAYLAAREGDPRQYDPDSLPYFKFIPRWVAGRHLGTCGRYVLEATPGMERTPVEGTCFQSVEVGGGEGGGGGQVSSTVLDSGEVEVTIHLGLPTSLLCHASFILATDEHIELEEVRCPAHRPQLWLPGEHLVTFPATPGPSPAQAWDLYQRWPGTIHRTQGTAPLPLPHLPRGGHLQPRGHPRPVRALPHPGGRPYVC